MTENETISKERPLCRVCRKKPVTTKGCRNGKRRFNTKCYSCSRPNRTQNPNDRRIFRQQFFIPCEHCGKIPEHISDFEIDHKDADRRNNNLENLQSLCVECHRIKTQNSGDYLPKHMKIIDETYRGAYKVPQGARMYSFTPFEVILNAVSSYEPSATHCEATWERNGDIIVGLKVIVWTDNSVALAEGFEELVLPER